MNSPTQQRWTGQWEQLKGRAKQLWPNLTDEDIKRAEGDYDALLDLINERTGESRKRIEELLNQ
jgi:uncharacterized protein YjbJ (UPF0337 family)